MKNKIIAIVLLVATFAMSLIPIIQKPLSLVP